MNTCSGRAQPPIKPADLIYQLGKHAHLALLKEGTQFNAPHAEECVSPTCTNAKITHWQSGC